MVVRGILLVIFIAILLVLTGCACEELSVGSVPSTNDIVEECHGDDHCLKKKGAKNVNAKVCAEIYNAGPQNKCFIEVAKESKDFTTCELTEPGAGAYAKEECYYQVALEKNDPNICDKILSTYQGHGTDIAKNGFDRETCIAKTSKGATKDKDCGEPLLPCCGDGDCDTYRTFCNPSFRCEKCGGIGEPCCPAGMQMATTPFCMTDEMTCTKGVCVAVVEE